MVKKLLVSFSCSLSHRLPHAAFNMSHGRDQQYGCSLLFVLAAAYSKLLLSTPSHLTITNQMFTQMDWVQLWEMSQRKSTFYVFVHNLATRIVPKVSTTVNNDSGQRIKTHQIADQKSSIFVTGSFFVLVNDCLVTDDDGCWSNDLYKNRLPTIVFPFISSVLRS